MAIQTTAQSGQGSSRGIRRWVLVGATLGATVALSAGIRSMTRDDAPAASVPPAIVQAPPIAANTAPVTVDTTPVLYLVDSPEQAEFMRRFAYEVNQIGGQ